MGEDNADAHLKRQIMGRIEDSLWEKLWSLLPMGDWILVPGNRYFAVGMPLAYGEFDGKRPKRYLIKVIGE